MAMQYYIDTTEQIIKDGALAEYGGKEKAGTDESSALSKYYKKLSDVSADIGNVHTYMNAKLVNSVGGEIKSDEVGQYLTELPTTTTGEE